MLHRIILFLCIFMFCSVVLAENNNDAPAEFQKVAKEWADSNYPGKIDKGTLYYSPEGTPGWAFIVDKKNHGIPGKNSCSPWKSIPGRTIRQDMLSCGPQARLADCSATNVACYQLSDWLETFHP